VDEQPTQDLELDVNPDTLLPGLFDGLVGLSQGESRDIPVHLPDDYRRTELAGQDVVFAVTLKEIKERELPPLDDELARAGGAGETLAELRQRVEERLRAAAERDAVFDQQKSAIDQLVAASQVEVPEVLVEDEIDRQVRNLAISLGQQGIDFEKLVEHGGADLQQMRQERRPQAEERVRQELVLDALAEREKLEPGDEHVDAEVREVLEGTSDAERLGASERVRAYVRERMRLQWALLWLSAVARGEAWAPPPPEALADGDAAAAGEIVHADTVETPPDEGGLTEI
jgi:trigger factor